MAVAANASTPMFIALQRSENAWRATLFASTAQGTIAAKLGNLPS